MPSDAPTPSPKIFLISFNKCGTGSFFRLFGRSGIAALHHHIPGDERAKQDPAASVAVTMFKNFMLARDPLAGLEAYTAFTDLAYYSDTMLFEAGRLYPYLHRYYPDAYFVLATRDVEAWLLSRLSHGGGSLAARTATLLGNVSREEVAAAWRAQFAAHNDEARAWFGARPEARFLQYDLDRDTPDRIAEFLSPDFAIKLAAWGRANVTPEEKKSRAATAAQKR
jgi:hypothetical protein